jgi:hypothetical protein
MCSPSPSLQPSGNREKYPRIRALSNVANNPECHMRAQGSFPAQVRQHRIFARIREIFPNPWRISFLQGELGLTVL